MRKFVYKSSVNSLRTDACHNWLIKNVTFPSLPTLLLAVKELLIADHCDENGIDMKITSREKSSRRLTGEHPRTDSVSQLAI